MVEIVNGRHSIALFKRIVNSKMPLTGASSYRDGLPSTTLEHSQYVDHCLSHMQQDESTILEGNLLLKLSFLGINTLQMFYHRPFVTVAPKPPWADWLANDVNSRSVVYRVQVLGMEQTCAYICQPQKYEFHDMYASETKKTMDMFDIYGVPDLN